MVFGPNQLPVTSSSTCNSPWLRHRIQEFVQGSVNCSVAENMLVFPGDHLQAFKAMRGCKDPADTEMLPVCRRYLPEEEDASKKLRKNSFLLSFLVLPATICYPCCWTYVFQHCFNEAALFENPCSGLRVTHFVFQMWADVLMCQRQASRQCYSAATWVPDIPG